MQRNPLNKWDKTRVRELFVQYRETDDKAIRDELVSLHLNLVKFLANKFSNRGEPIDDLYQVGCMALVKAVERFDTSVGAEFTTYATPTIIGEIKRYFRDKGWAMRVPRRLQELKLAVTRAYETLTTTLERPPTVQEIAKQLGVTDEEVLEAQELGQSYKLFSLNSDFEDDDNAKLSNMLDYLGQPDLQLERLEDQMQVSRVMQQLSRRERLVVFLRFYQSMTQTEVASLLGVSQMHVSRIQKQALDRMKQMLQPGAKQDLKAATG